MNKGILIFPVGVIIGLFMLGVSLSTGYPTWLDGNTSIECRYPIEINRSVINGDNDIFNFPIVVNGINVTYLDYLPLKELIDDGYLDSNCNCLWIVNNISNDSIGLEWHFANKTSDNYGCYTNNAEIWVLAPEIPDIPYIYIDDNCGASSDTQNLTGPFFNYNLNLHFAEETGLGSTTYGTSKYMNNGTLFDDTFFRPGKSGYSLMLDGDEDYVKINDDDELDGFQNFTIEYWYNPEASQNAYAHHISKGDWNTPAQRSYSIRRRYQASNTYQVFITWSDGTNSVWVVSKSETAGEWYHMALTYDGYYVEFYQNAVRIGNWAIAGKSVNASTYDLYIGGYVFNPTPQDLNGRIDEVKIKPEYSREVEIKRAYEIGRSTLKARQCQVMPPPPIYTAFSGKTEYEYLIRANCNWQTENYCDMGIMAGYDDTTDRILCCLIIGVE